MTEARIPTRPTLRRYGLTAEEWSAMLARQGGGCGVCGRVPPSGTLHIDHQHVRGWRKMAPAERKKYVRGLLCFPDNSALRYRIDIVWLNSATDYMRAYIERGVAIQ